MISSKYEIESFERLSFKEKIELINSTGAKLSVKFNKGHLLELYSMGAFFVQVGYTANKPDQVLAFFSNDEKVDFFLKDT